MSEGMLGADLDSLRDLAKAASLSGQDLDDTATALQSAVAGTRWVGFDADSFRNRWASNMRPTLHAASASLANMSKLLIAQADEQEKASSDTGGGSGGGAGGSHGTGGPGGAGGSGNGSGAGTAGNPAPDDEKSWSDAFTDPNYQHAPSGLEWGFEKLFGEDGAQFQGVGSGLKFVADKFDFDIGLANADEMAAMMPKFSKFMGAASGALAVLGGVIGALDIASGYENQDPFRVADGGISAALAVTALAATATGVGAPVGIALGAVGLVWGLASIASGDVPVTKRIWDVGAGVVGGVQDVANAVGNSLGWLGGKLGFG